MRCGIRRRGAAWRLRWFGANGGETTRMESLPFRFSSPRLFFSCAFLCSSLLFSVFLRRRKSQFFFFFSAFFSAFAWEEIILCRCPCLTSLSMPLCLSFCYVFPGDSCLTAFFLFKFFPANLSSRLGNWERERTRAKPIVFAENRFMVRNKRGYIPKVSGHFTGLRVA